MIKVIVFLLMSGVILAISWHDLKKQNLHGVFRFIAFESIMILMLINIDFWIYRPFSIFQIVSWLLLAGSIVLVWQGAAVLKRFGKIEDHFDSTTMLVNEGVYKYIRHPLYSSLLYLAWGAFFKNVSADTILVVAIATIALIATAKSEERYNIRKFGDSYVAYMKQTRMFIPGLFVIAYIFSSSHK